MPYTNLDLLAATNPDIFADTDLDFVADTDLDLFADTSSDAWVDAAFERIFDRGGGRQNPTTSPERRVASGAIGTGSGEARRTIDLEKKL